MHAIQGIGDGFIPELFDPEVVTDIIEVSDQDAIACAKELALKMGYSLVSPAARISMGPSRSSRPTVPI